VFCFFHIFLLLSASHELNERENAHVVDHNRRELHSQCHDLLPDPSYGRGDDDHENPGTSTLESQALAVVTSFTLQIQP